MPARRSLAAASVAGRASLLSRQRSRAALRRRPRPGAPRGLAGAEPPPGKSAAGGGRRGHEAAESAGCAPVTGEKHGGREVAGTGGPVGCESSSEGSGSPPRSALLALQPAAGIGEMASVKGSQVSSRRYNRAALGLTRKQWRNRQKNKRRQKNKFKASNSQPQASSATEEPPDDQGSLTPDTEVPSRQTPSLRQRLESRLDAARFRYINQLLYTHSSQEAAQLFQEDPEALAVYHRGFALQAACWPERPVERFVHYLRRRPASLVVADFGCGDCTLARSLPNRVHCFDLVALDPRVTVCDMAQVPLEDASVDVAVFCLALMGTNLREILQEAHRVLRAGGTLLVAEVASRFADLRAFLAALTRLGFRLISKDVSGSHFYTFELRKTDAAKAADEPRGLALRPCLYKRR